MWIKVNSSNIAEVAHEVENSTLKVRFHNFREYHYENVDAVTFLQLVEAPSVGRAFHQLIKSQPEAYPASLYPGEDVTNVDGNRGCNAPWGNAPHSSSVDGSGDTAGL